MANTLNNMKGINNCITTLFIEKFFGLKNIPLNKKRTMAYEKNIPIYEIYLFVLVYGKKAN